MRLKQPRIAPVPESAWTQQQRDLVGGLANWGKTLNIFRTFLGHPPAMKAFMDYGGYILSKKNSVAAREREIVILRTGYLCRSGYEWAQHVEIGLRSGLTAEEIARIKAGPDAPGWSALDRALLRAADDLYADRFISTPTWALLKAHLSDQQCIDLLLTIGQYTQVSMFLNSVGVQLDEGLVADLDLVAYEAPQ